MNNNKKRILIVGAGPGQLSIIKIAKDLGYYVYVVSVAGNYPGFAYADEFEYIDIFDVDAIIEYARNKNIQGVLSDQSDMAAPIVAKVAEALGLPTWGYENALKFTDKARMRSVFAELGLPMPLYSHVKSLKQAKDAISSIGFPVVIKPTDSFASRGVYKVYNETDLIKLFPETLRLSRSGNVIVEQFLQGDQYFCQGFVQNHKLRLFAFSDRYYYNLPSVAIPYTNAFPAKISQDFQNRMSETFEKVVNYLSPEFGHVWAEWIYNKDTDTLYIVEMAIRGGGAFVTDNLIPSAYGIDSRPFLVRASMGDNSVCFEKEEIVQRAAAFYSFLLPEGRIITISGLEKVNGIRGVIKSDFRKMEIGDIVSPVVNKDSRYGMILIEGNSRDEVDSVLMKVKSVLDIRVLNNNVERRMIWE